jgi:hypothetical protein
MLTNWIKTQDGKEYPIRFNMTVFYQLAKELKIPSNQLTKFLSGFDTWEIDWQYKLFLYAFESGARKEGVEFKMKELDFIDWIGDDPTIQPKIEEILIKSMVPDDADGKSKKAVRKPT